MKEINILDRILSFTEKNKKTIFVLSVLSTSLVLSIVYHYSDFCSDDLIYMNKWQSDIPLENMSDIFEYQVNHYFLWGGRTVAHTILQVLLLIGKPISAILNSVVYLLLAYLIVKISIKKFDIYFYFLVLGLIYFINPIFEETILWYTGNANYMWTITITLTALYPFISIDNKNGYRNNVLFLPFAFLAGWCNENISTSILVLMVYIIFKEYKKNKKK